MEIENILKVGKEFGVEDIKNVSCFMVYIGEEKGMHYFKYNSTKSSRASVIAVPKKNIRYDKIKDKLITDSLNVKVYSIKIEELNINNIDY